MRYPFGHDAAPGNSVSEGEWSSCHVTGRGPCRGRREPTTELDDQWRLRCADGFQPIELACRQPRASQHPHQPRRDGTRQRQSLRVRVRVRVRVRRRRLSDRFQWGDPHAAGDEHQPTLEISARGNDRHGVILEWRELDRDRQCDRCCGYHRRTVDLAAESNAMRHSGLRIISSSMHPTRRIRCRCRGRSDCCPSPW